MKNRLAALAIAALAASQIVVPVTSAPAAEEGVHSPNMHHVANIEYELKYNAQIQNGTDLEFTRLKVGGKLRDFAVTGSYLNGMHIIDISRPAKPRVAGVYDCAVSQGDVQVFKRGRKTYATFASDYGINTASQCFKDAGEEAFLSKYGTFIADITNPSKPKTAGYWPFEDGSHNMTVHPSGKYMYNSNNELTTTQATVEVVDISNIAKPKTVSTLDIGPGLDSHDVTFNAKGNRAYSAAVTHTVVMDTSDPAKPRVIGRIYDPAINIHHQADPITIEDPVLGKKTFLVVTDELAGAAGNGACPGGGLHVYDITGELEQAPVKVGYWSIPEVRPAGGGGATGDSLTCTAHVLRMHPKEKLMTIAWYNAGVRVVDLSGLIGVSAGAVPDVGNVGVGMKEIGYYYFENSDTWSVKTNKIAKNGSFYLYGNDMIRGFDVYHFDAKAQQSADPGTWLTPEKAADLLVPQVQPIGSDNAPVCLLAGLRN